MVCFYYYFLSLLQRNTEKEDCPHLVIDYTYNKHQKALGWRDGKSRRIRP